MCDLEALCEYHRTLARSFEKISQAQAQRIADLERDLASARAALVEAKILLDDERAKAMRGPGLVDYGEIARAATEPAELQPNAGRCATVGCLRRDLVAGKFLCPLHAKEDASHG